jgi:hypothetical protein
MQRFLAAVGAIVIAGSAPSPAAACNSASCSLASRPGGGGLRRGQLLVDVSFRHLDQGRPLVDGRAAAPVGTGRPAILRPRVDFEAGRLVDGGHLEWRGTGSYAQVDVGYGVTSRVGVVVSIPLGRQSVLHHTLDAAHTTHGDAPRPLAIGGLGDVQVSTLVQLGRGWQAGAAVKLPSGSSTERDALGRIADPIQQPGTGATAVVGLLQYRARLPLGASATAGASYQRASTNDLGYRMGDDLIATLQLSRSIRGGFAVTAQVRGRRAERNAYRGEPVLSTGGTALYASPGLRWTARGGATFQASVQLPVRQQLNESQLGTRAAVLLGVSRSF